MTIRITKNILSKAFKNLPKLGLLVCKYIIWHTRFTRLFCLPKSHSINQINDNVAKSDTALLVLTLSIKINDSNCYSFLRGKIFSPRKMQITFMSCKIIQMHT
jgi:hypothetical protein